MDMSNPFLGVVAKKMSTEELARAIMQDIAAELDAVFLYQAHIDATDDERARNILAHIRDEEKQHAAEFLSLLKLLDPGMEENMRVGSADAEKMLRELSGKVEKTKALTVGDLVEK